MLFILQQILLHKHRVIHLFIPVDGLCYGLPSGELNVEVRVGVCPGVNEPSDCFTGLFSTSNLFISEIHYDI